MILGLLLVAGMGYIIYQHYAAPFKAIKQAKETKANIEKNAKIMQDMAQNDKVLQERLDFLLNSEEYKNLPNDKQGELLADTIVERFNEVRRQQNNENKTD